MANKKPSYQDLREELDSVLATLQDGQLDIDEAANAYERGMTIVRELEAYIKSAQNKITKIKKSFDK